VQNSPAAAEHRALVWIAIIALAGLSLRIQAAAGALWLDEAWSAVFAHDAETPLGIFTRINHDNNHHLNSLWLQWVGLGAPPLVARALSVLSGTAAIVMAGLIGLRRSPAAGVVTALLFALSPALVTLGSEARGYAPMMLAALIAIWLVDRWLDGRPKTDHPIAIAACFYVGALFQLTMIFAACAIVGWAFLVLCYRQGPRAALSRTARLFGPGLAAIAAAVLLVFGPALSGRAEFTYGAYQPFTLLQFWNAVVRMLGFAIGLPTSTVLLPAGVLVVLILARALGTSRLALYWIAIVAFPLSLAMLRMMNPGHPRYYLLIGLALLLLMGEGLAALIRARGWRRLAAAAALTTFAAGSAWANLDLIETRRGDPGPAIRAMAARAPGGTTVLVERQSGIALVVVAAAEQAYPLRYATACPARPYLFIDRYGAGSRGPPRVTRCGAAYRAIAAAESHGFSGQNWTLYERVD